MASDSHSNNDNLSSTEQILSDGESSWNPALRPDSHAHKRNTSTDDFFDRYPGATPEKSRRKPQIESIADEQDVVDEDAATIPVETREQPLPQELVTDAASESVSHEHNPDPFQRVNSEHILVKSEAITAPSAILEQDPAEEVAPEINYEHQGETTELEAAIDESEAAPLMDDEEQEPTVQTISRNDTLSTNPDPSTRPIERSFTTNFTEVPEVETESQPAVKISEDWPAVGDDKTFAELLDNGEAKVESNAHEQSKTESNQAASKETTQEDDPWAAAFGDDEILEENDEMDPTSFFGEDDDGFLDDEPEVAPTPATTQPARPATQSRTASYVPTNQASTRPAFGTTTSSFMDQAHGRSNGTPSTGLYDLYGQSQVPTQQPPTRPSAQTAQSFVDKPKSDYASPYDLPMEVVKQPRRRPQVAATAPQSSTNAVPPRSSSFAASPTGAGLKNAMPPPSSVASLSPPPSSHGIPTAPPSASLPAKQTPNTDSGFFADLPVTTKTRPRPYTPQSSAKSTPQLRPSQSYGPAGVVPNNLPPQPLQQPPQSFQQPTQNQSFQPAGPQPAAIDGLGLRRPDTAPLFPDQITPPSTMQSQSQSPPQFSQAQTRYSPAVPSNAQSQAAARFSPAPAATPGKNVNRYSVSPTPPNQPSRAQAFVPRTSSPLAVHGRPQSQGSVSDDNVRSISAQLSSSPGKAIYDAPVLERRESSTSKYAPSNASDSGLGMAFSPRRQNTTSPSQLRKPSLASPSSIPPTFNVKPAVSFTPQTQTATRKPAHLPHRRQFSRDIPFAAPVDERAQDPLERWKGHPIFHWTASGVVTSSFPKQTPFYASGTSGPNIKCTPGDLKLVEAHHVLALDEVDSKFPGPLPARSKGKKKELLVWLSSKVESITKRVETARLNFELSAEEMRGLDEKLILWRVMRVFLEHDGVLEGSAKIEEEIRHILLPDLAQRAQMVDLQSPISAAPTTIDTVDSSVLAQIMQSLQEGQREKAAWLAEEKRLWGHAMLIASTVGPDLFKQIVGSFVRNQVKSQGGSEFRSLAALYQVFAGSPEDCVDELVPPSARAGFQMISKTDGKSSADALTGLDRWQDTLALIHSNPTPGNSASLLALGKLLAGYGRIEAAHTCYLFARSSVKHGGSDDAEAHFVLLGADLTSGVVDLDALMLTEIFEFTSSLSAPSTASHYIPHLQAYKLIHGQHLAAYGHKAQAQAYCEHVDAAIRATTRPSGYYNQALAQELVALNSHLSQTPHSGAGGKFFSRPAMDKVSSGVGSWLSKFVSGEDGESDNAQVPAATEVQAFGPFGGVNGDSGPISRTASVTDLYQPGSLSTAMQQQQASMPSRYTPLSQASSGGRYAPAGAAASLQSRSSFDGDSLQNLQAPSSMPAAEPHRSASGRYAPVSANQSPALLAVQSSALSRKTSSQSLLSTGSYEPKPLLAEQDGYGYSAPTSAAVEEPITNGHSFDDPVPVQATTEEDAYDPETGAPASNQYAPPDSTPSFQPYQPETSFQPYQPDDSYQPYQPDTTTFSPADDEPKPKKKSFMDDDEDDDIAARAAALKTAPSASSREPDPAILAAAQADEARQKQGHNKQDSNAGWFGGWFGKKDPNAAPGPIKAKLGEESSFYFDKDLNKWVNKKGGADAATAAAPTPPPPRAPSGTLGSGPPSRMGASPAPPGSGPPSRQSTPAMGAPPAGLKPAPAVNGSMPPPARPASTMSTASSLDDLLAAPSGAKKAAAKGKKKGGRYVDVMANAK